MISLDRIRNLPGDKFSQLVRAGMRDPAVKAVVAEALAEQLLTDIAPAPEVVRGRYSEPAPKKSRKAKRKAPAKKAAPAAANGAADGGEQKIDESVEKVREFIHAASGGMSSTVIVKGTRLPKAKVQRALRVLKDAGVVHMAGERRFARWAKDRDLAITASVAARGGS